MSWLQVLLDGAITGVLTGIIAGLVAYGTVRWTQKGDARRARLAESHRAAETLTRAATETWTVLAEANPLRDASPIRAAVGRWHSEVVLQLPALQDPDVADRCHKLSDAFDEFLAELERLASLAQVDVDGNDVETSELVQRSRLSKQRLGAMHKWVGVSLAMHRREEPLPGPPL